MFVIALNAYSNHAIENMAAHSPLAVSAVFVVFLSNLVFLGISKQVRKSDVL
jgi:hypothetical protein